MFGSLFTPRHRTAALFPDGMDRHTHILWGVDDGASTPQESLAIIRTLKSLGFSGAYCTPHIKASCPGNTPDKLRRRFNELLSAAAGEAFKLELAAEYMLDDHFMQLVQSEKLLTLKKNHVLVEMSYINAPIQLYAFLFDLQVAGYIPVLAHPERYLFYHSHLDEYLKLKKAGCLFQLNLLSAVGYYGDGIAKIAEKLLQKGMYDFVGSDVHHSNHIAAFDQKVRLKDLLPLKEAIANNQFFRMEEQLP